ncbi:hypothetical protein ACFL4Y_02850 [Gemmatimonadota bacterium]
MDSGTTWALLRLSTAVLALTLSILLWYAKHFVDTLKDAELRSPLAREALERSPRIMVIIIGVLFVLVTTILTGSVLVEASRKALVQIPKGSSGYWLVLLCMAVPILGSVTVIAVALANIGWLQRITWLPRRVLAFLKPSIESPILIPPTVDAGEAETAWDANDMLKVSRSTLMSWSLAFDWIRRNESRWDLGAGFLRVNRSSLRILAIVQLIQHTKPLVDERVQEVEELLSQRISKILLAQGARNSLLLNRPRQLARAALWLSHEAPN